MHVLIEFRVENHRSIRDEQVFTFEASRARSDGDGPARDVGGRLVLPAAGIYGANASGKSNVLLALDFMFQAVVFSHRMWPPDGGVPREAFGWGPVAEEPSTFEVTLVLEGVRYEYGFVVDDDVVLEEWLFAWPKGRKQVWFERDGDVFKFGDRFHGENQVVRSVTRQNALFLATAAQHGHDGVAAVHGWFRRIESMVVFNRHLPLRRPRDAWLRGGRRLSYGSSQLALFGENAASEDLRARLLDLLRAADVGIIGFEQVWDDEPGPFTRSRYGGGIRVQHKSKDHAAWLPLEQESDGTIMLFRLGPVVLDVLAEGGLLLVDELEASLHPLLAHRIVQLFNNPATNPRHAQLLFTTHDTNLVGTMMGPPTLVRDQVWLTEKDHEGATVLYPLSDYQPRKHENVERGYLQGRYGAIPFLGPLAPGAE